jgi:predicted transcriptional regulator
MHNYFAKLGLEPEVADLYLTLHTYGPQSLLQLARNARIERTRIYRLLDSLTDVGLIEIETHAKRKIYKAAPITNIQILLSKKEQDLQAMHDELQGLQVELSQTLHSPLSHVQFYKGSDGLKQMFWNQTRANGDTISILYENMQNRTNSAFFERWVDECNRRDLHCRSLIGKHFIETQQEWYAEHSNERLHNWSARYIATDIFPITHSMVCYDDVVSYFNWQGGEVFGIELHNQQIADAQRCIFEMLWTQGSPVDDVKISKENTPTTL